MRKNESLETNVRKMYAIKALRWFHLVTPVVFMPFFAANGLTMTEIMLLQSAYSAGILLLEVPTGYMADRLGRKACMVIGCMLSAVGFGMYSVSYGLWSFLAAEFTIGVASSFVSGTDAALVFESLAKTKKDYRKVEGRREAIGNISEGVASIIGGLLATISLRLPFYAETFVMCLTVPVALSLQEPVRVKYVSRGGSLRGIFDVLAYVLRERPALKWLLLYLGIVTASTLNIVWFFEPYMKNAAMPAIFFGFAWAGFKIAIGVFAPMAYKFEDRLGKKNALLALLAISISGYMLLGLVSAQLGVLFFIATASVRGMSAPIFRNIISENSPNDRRATVLSVWNLIGRLVFSAAGPLIGFAHDHWSSSQALVGAGMFFLAAGCFAFVSIKPPFKKRFHGLIASKKL